MAATFPVRPHRRRWPRSPARPGAAVYDFRSDLRDAWGRAERCAVLAVNIVELDERARRAADEDVRREAAAGARRLRRERLRVVADRRDATGDLAARLDAFAAGADDGVLDELAALLGAGDPEEGGPYVR